MWFKLLLFQDDILNLRREHIDATDNQHIVATAEDTIHTDKRTATGTFLIVERRQVMSTIAQQRHTFLGQMSKRQFTEGSFRQWLASIGIKYFRIKQILVEVGTTLVLALIADTRTGNLTQTIDIIGLDA